MSEWIRCSDRLPTKADADCNGYIWTGYNDPITRKVGEVQLKYVNVLLILSKRNPEACYWMPTGLTRPEPPQ